MSLLSRLAVRLISVVCVFSLAACATAPEFRHAPTGVNPSPRYALQLIDQQPNVLWGGMILDVRHFERYTELEMLAFPLDSGLRPIPRGRDAGRFVALRAGHLDPLEFSVGRFLTIAGRVTGDRELDVRGERERVAEMDAMEIQVWPEDWNLQPPPRVRVGIGISGGIH